VSSGYTAESYYGGVGAALLARVLYEVFSAQSAVDALRKFERLLFIMPPRVRAAARAAMAAVDVPPERVEEVKSWVEARDLDEEVADYIIEEERAERRLAVGLEVVSGFLHDALFMIGWKLPEALAGGEEAGGEPSEEELVRELLLGGEEGGEVEEE